MVPPRHILLVLLPLLLAAWSGCPCVYSRWIASAQGEALAVDECECPCCHKDAAPPSDTDAPSEPPPCERRSARNADLPPAAPELVAADTSVMLLALLPVDAPTPGLLAQSAFDHGVSPAPPDRYRRGIVLLN